MKPNFALSLSFDGIRLLHRQQGGWGRVGDVDLGTEDLAGALEALRQKADALGAGPVTTKLIIPDEQIKYLTVDASGLDKSSLHDAVMQALDGATPYPVDELAFDFALVGSIVHIAAVAQETLTEAEAFAVDHNFDPVGYVAAPMASNFPKEPNFGVSKAARERGIADLQTDPAPVFMTGEAMAAAATQPDPVSQPDTQSQTAGAPDNAPVAGFSSRRSDTVPPATAPAPSVGAPSATPAEPMPKLSGVQRAPEIPDTAQGSLPSAAEAVPDRYTKAPPITGMPPDARDPEQTRLDIAALRPGAADAPLDDVPDMPAFVAKPRGDDLAPLGAPSPRVSANVLTAEIPVPKDGPTAADRAASLAKGAGSKALAGASAGARKLFERRDKPGPAPAAPTDGLATPQAGTVAGQTEGNPREDEKNRLTIFGARKPKKKGQDPIPVGGKPRFLGLILTAILLLFLVSVAAWASVFLDEGIARFFGGDKRDRAIAELATPEELADTGEDIQIAALDTSTEALTESTDPAAPSGLSQVAPPPVLTPQEAEARYAATGIWLATPQQPPLPTPMSLEDVYVPSIDGKISGEDAIALLGPDARKDAKPEAVQTPAPAGTTYDFDENGFVKAMPDGARTPEGAVVYSGRPAVVPPRIPQRLLQPAETAVPPSQVEAPVIAALPSARPKLRPGGLVEKAERTMLGGNTRDELAKLRPQLRPRVEKQKEEEVALAAPPTKQAVATSRKPDTRPGNFARLVSRAKRNQQKQDQQQTTQVASVAPRSVTPRIPSSASVTRAATQKNAINLSRVNLIGVYGKPSSRRALVRLSSGRYKKVKIGDRVDGGRVSAIGENQLKYTKGGRSITLRMPKG